MISTVSCDGCQSREICPSYSKLFASSAQVDVITELELHTSQPDRLARVLVGVCTKIDQPVAVDIGKIPVETEQDDQALGVYNMRVIGIPTVRIDLDCLDPAPEAPIVVSEFIKAALG